MKKNKKVLIILGVAILLIALFTTAYVLLTTPDKDTTLTALEKRWVEQNKNNVINVAVLNDIPIYGYEGEGVFFDYLKSFEKDIKLEFNRVSYNYGDDPSLYEYKFEIVDTINDNQISFYNDYYVAISKDSKRFDTVNDFSNVQIGTLTRKLSDVTYYLADTGATFTSKDTIDDLFKSLENDEIEVAVIPYVMYLDSLMAEDYNIVYNFKDIKDCYVLTLSDENTTVNNIIQKYYDLWKTDEYEESYNSKLLSLYFSANNISTKKQADFKGKVYTYGLVENVPFEKIVNNKLVGINAEYLNNFATFSETEIRFKQYDSIEELKKAFDNDEIDMMFNNFSNTESGNNYITTSSVYNEEYVIITHVNNSLVIDSIKSLDGKTVYTLKNSLISDYIRRNTKADIKTYENNSKLLNNLQEDMIIAMDYDTYNYYKTDKLSKYLSIYTGKINSNYNFMLKDNNSNKTFNELFNFYINGINNDRIKSVAYQKLIINPKNETVLQTLINYLLYIVLPVIVIFGLLIFLFEKKKTQNVIKKDEKLRYIDMLTSLKNRNYLNANIGKWDESKIYPQTVVIVDLNNVKYINDNFGHEEGDNVIKAAANILIRTQLENSEIIRTDGNEFLIYLISYSEDEIINYMRKLYKEMKELPHGFGAAFGYSIINDETKIIDDAINEATLDMRTNKEA